MQPLKEILHLKISVVIFLIKRRPKHYYKEHKEHEEGRERADCRK